MIKGRTLGRVLDSTDVVIIQVGEQASETSQVVTCVAGVR
jgi:hypothetical protein